MTTADQAFERFLRDGNTPFAGWDFGYISDTGRMVESPLPWSYASLVVRYLAAARSLLDMGTGGGEFLSLMRPLPDYTAATEGYPPNFPIARERLAPLGIEVHTVEDDASLPFPDNSFDLVINRHESYAVSEVERILKPGGHFITQQVGGDNDNELNRLLGAPANDEYAHWNLAYAVNEFTGSDLEVIWRAESEVPTRFYDIGAVVYYLQAVPWQIPDFSVDAYRDHLRHLHDIILADGYLDIPSSRFILIARKPA